MSRFGQTGLRSSVQSAWHFIVVDICDPLGGRQTPTERFACLASRLGSYENLVCCGAFAVNFQVTVLKVLASYPDGFASLNNLKRDMAVLAASGKDWTERTQRLAARLPNLEIFSQGLVVRLEDGWRITQRGRSILEMMER